MNPWYVVSCVAAATVIVFLLFLLESFISAKISEIRHRKLEKQYLNQALDKIVDEIWKEMQDEKWKEGKEDDIKSE